MTTAATSSQLANLIRANIRPRTDLFAQRERAGIARLGRFDGGARPGAVEIPAQGAISATPREFPEPDGPGAARLDALERALDMVRKAFPVMETDVRLCLLSARLLEGAWLERARTRPGTPVPGQDEPCDCVLCGALPSPPRRHLSDYAWRRSSGQPVAVKTWPFRQELDSVLMGGWAWNRALQDADTGRDLRFRYEDDFLSFLEYKRSASEVDIAGTARRIEKSLTENFSFNGARALISGLFIAHKRSVDEYWIGQHRRGAVALPQSTPLDLATYSMLQMLDCEWWHVAPDEEQWLEENLAVLAMSRVVDDMVDARADAVTGEINSLWLASMSTHDKAVLAACVLAQVKYICMPESRGVLYNNTLVANTAAWMGLAGRHAVWFDGIPAGLPPTEDCVLCELEPNSCAGLLTSGVTLRTGCRPRVDTLGPACAALSERCRSTHPQAWRLFHEELSVFEALHGEWHGDVDACWEILRRTYVAAVVSAVENRAGVHGIQADSAPLGTSMFHVLHVGTPTWQENTVMLNYMFGCAHPHFFWTGQGYAPTAVGGDWVDG
jgi:hypothetical protein